jgi:Tfp pilus assembly protein PilV
MTRLRNILRQRRDEAGVTLVEVSLTMLILAIVMTVALDFLDRTSEITVRTDLNARTEDDVQRTLRTVTQHLRGAAPIEGTCTAAGFATTYDKCVTFSVKRITSGYQGCAATRYSVGLVGTGAEKNLVIEETQRTGTAPSCSDVPGSTRRSTLLTKVVNDSTQPLLTYYGPDGSVVDAVATPANVPKATTVKVGVHVRHSTKAASIVMESSAALRNNIVR